MRLTIDVMRARARALGGQCLSKRYVNTATKLVWRCNTGHVWRALPSAIKQGHWCDRCFDDRRRGSLGPIRELARSRGGECLARVYRNAKEIVSWRCGKGHRWRATIMSIKAGSWCRVCAGKSKHTIEAMRRLAVSRGGRLRSKRYINALTHLEWECAEGHRWLAKPNSVLSGTWCPSCGVYISERIARVSFEQLFGRPFPRVRPAWLVSERGFPLELDGYCPELKLAFEYNGKQHYARAVHFGISGRSLLSRRRDDNRKGKLCAKRGIELIAIPYSVRVSKIPHFVAAECMRRGIKIPGARRPETVDTSRAYLKSEIKPLRVLAISRGGRCLSERYEGADVRMRWKCNRGHEWLEYPWRVRSGAWCTKCASLVKRAAHDALQLKRLADIAAKHKGRCLANKYVNSVTRVPWECQKGHRWLATPANVLHHETWCSRCAGYGVKRVRTV